jgi:hypothetical protein
MLAKQPTEATAAFLLEVLYMAYTSKKKKVCVWDL